MISLYFFFRVSLISWFESVGDAKESCYKRDRRFLHQPGLRKAVPVIPLQQTSKMTHDKSDHVRGCRCGLNRWNSFASGL